MHTDSLQITLQANKTAPISGRWDKEENKILKKSFYKRF